MQGVIISSNISVEGIIASDYIGDIHVIITLSSAKQLFNDKVKLSNEIEPFRSQVHFYSVPVSVMSKIEWDII